MICRCGDVIWVTVVERSIKRRKKCDLVATLQAKDKEPINEINSTLLHFFLCCQEEIETERESLSAGSRSGGDGDEFCGCGGGIRLVSAAAISWPMISIKDDDGVGDNADSKLLLEDGGTVSTTSFTVDEGRDKAKVIVVGDIASRGT